MTKSINRSSPDQEKIILNLIIHNSYVVEGSRKLSKKNKVDKGSDYFDLAILN